MIPASSPSNPPAIPKVVDPAKEELQSHLVERSPSPCSLPNPLLHTKFEREKGKEGKIGLQGPKRRRFGL
ncbi:hypothetical protein RHGRI_003044 [Rhododendron griersonianum]|uniref:Uncharacterized protein n=1 Tax=Rhododendron griersonianum TaxID=479676 RepID=A0AAV6LSI6_9ERIC|nr:hypothetical protein RHGRI_003044 [Rhododendron griersonianum]